MIGHVLFIVGLILTYTGSMMSSYPKLFIWAAWSFFTGFLLLIFSIICWCLGV